MAWLGKARESPTSLGTDQSNEKINPVSMMYQPICSDPTHTVAKADSSCPGTAAMHRPRSAHISVAHVAV